MGKVRVEEVRGRRRRRRRRLRRRRLGRRRTRRVRRQVEPGKFFVETIPISAPTYFLQHHSPAPTTIFGETPFSKVYQLHFKGFLTDNKIIKAEKSDSPQGSLIRISSPDISFGSDLPEEKKTKCRE